jgi:hypothetical protein
MRLACGVKLEVAQRRFAPASTQCFLSMSVQPARRLGAPRIGEAQARTTSGPRHACPASLDSVDSFCAGSGLFFRDSVAGRIWLQLEAAWPERWRAGPSRRLPTLVHVALHDRTLRHAEQGLASIAH